MEDRISLVGQMVKTIDEDNDVDVTQLIAFMYPSYVVRDEISFDYENNVIYTGPYSHDIKDILGKGTKSFIAITNMGVQDIDMTSRSTCIEVLYSKWGKSPGEAAKQALDSMTWTDFLRYFKTFWVSGRSTIEEKKVFLYDLYRVLGTQRHDIMKQYFNLRETFPDSVIFSGLMSFLGDSCDTKSSTRQTGSYPRLVQDFGRGYRAIIPKVIQEAFQFPCETDEDREFRTIWTLLQFGKGNVI